MKKFINNKGILIIALAVIIVLVMALSSAFMGGRASIVSNAVGVIISPVEKGVANIIGWFDSIYSYMYEYDAIKEENEELRLQIAEMEEEIRESQENNEENARLRELLELREKRRDFEFETATIISWGTSNWTSSFTISKGTMDGVEAQDCVITAGGDLVGIVTEVGVNWATVTTVIDTDIEVGTLIFRTGEAAVAEGSFELMQEGKLKLSYLAGDSELLNGDIVMTSGKGGVYPSDLVIGTIEEVGTEASGVSEYAVIKPSADISNLTEVFVIKSFDIVE